MKSEIEALSKIFPEWGRFLGVRAKETPVPIYDWEHKELHQYELDAYIACTAKLEQLIEKAREDERRKAIEWASNLPEQRLSKEGE